MYHCYQTLCELIVLLLEFGGFDVNDVFPQVVEFVDLLSTFTIADAIAVSLH